MKYSILFFALIGVSCKVTKEEARVASFAPSTAQIAEHFDAKSEEFFTGIQLEKGKVYRITPQVTESPWDDAGNAADFEGWHDRSGMGGIGGLMTRFQFYPLYALIGCVDEVVWSKCFKIGNGLSDYQAAHSGELIVFVNDVLYFNNNGKASITVELSE